MYVIKKLLYFVITKAKEKLTMESIAISKFNQEDISDNVYSKFSKIYSLSKRQTECLFYISLGYSMKEIANKFSISPRTIEYHIMALKEKLNVNLRSQLVCFFHKAMV